MSGLTVPLPATERLGVALLAVAALTGCAPGESDSAELELPVLLTTELPFIYPPNLYLQRVEGQVGLRLFIDSLGLVVAESTTVAEPSPYPAFDSAAEQGVPRLEFRPARRGPGRIGHAVLLPVVFRKPTGDPAPNDTSPRR